MRRSVDAWAPIAETGRSAWCAGVYWWSAAAKATRTVHRRDMLFRCRHIGSVLAPITPASTKTCVAPRPENWPVAAEREVWPVIRRTVANADPLTNTD
jgi:hypothetical protein